MEAGPTIRITQVGAYVFTVDFGAALPDLLTDEAPPVGTGTGPVPEQMLIAGVANCLCASLVFALGKFRQDAQGVTAEAACRVARNPEGRLRITGIDVHIRLGAEAAAMPRIDRVLDQFQRFCTVSESVKAGIPVSVSVEDGGGTRLA
ncbi:OsmC family protein [Methylobacterium sp. E-066]|uniref:OsmC family protein n=1 Tax=Methylobacterium sp. E-066 TaxID=2836584 RepID=UPI001FB94AB2|nr:OsmC family protein [Methylobacterium sp. E-066]MCJ2144044.1 OsmC family protein [Methylobacterium sp. E-066]